MRRSSRARAHRGGTLIYVVVAMVMLMGMAAVAIDVSMMYSARRRAQSVADAAALAAGPLLPSLTAAQQQAQNVAAANSASGGAFTITGITFATAASPTITLDDGTTATVAPNCAATVTGYINAPIGFGALLGYKPTSKDGKANTRSVSASATVMIDNVCSVPSGTGVVPIGIVADNPTSSDPTVAYISQLLTTASNSQAPLPNTYQTSCRQVVLQTGQWSSGKLTGSANGFVGNCGAIALGGSGTSAYCNAISTKTTQTCHVGDVISTTSGNVCSQTEQGISDRLSGCNATFTHNCDDYDSWFFGSCGYPIDYSIPAVQEGCSTHYFHQDPHRQELTDAHVMIVPLISQPGKNGKSGACVLAFGAFWLDVENCGYGNYNGAILGRFIGLTVPQSSGGGCVGAGSFIPPRLVK